RGRLRGPKKVWCKQVERAARWLMVSWHHHRFKGKVEIVGNCLENVEKLKSAVFRASGEKPVPQAKISAGKGARFCFRASGGNLVPQAKNCTGL
ncbi:hypothetical protein L195_g060226, partial [Trifolium pratense]